MDGLKFDQLQNGVTPFISNFYKNGIHCPIVEPVFPTKTIVNHFSIATGIHFHQISFTKSIMTISRKILLFAISFSIGLYAGSHGVTSNKVYDNVKRELISYSPELFMSRANVTPIWTLNEMAGKGSAVSMWASGEFEFRGKTPTYVEKFVTKTAWKPRIDKLIPLLKRNKDPVNLVMFYSEEPDYAGHEFAPHSNEVIL